LLYCWHKTCSESSKHNRFGPFVNRFDSTRSFSMANNRANQPKNQKRKASSSEKKHLAISYTIAGLFGCFAATALISTAQAAPDKGGTRAVAAASSAKAPIVVDSSRTAGGVYRSKMSDGTIVFSDRPLENSSNMTVSYYGPGPDGAEQARRERDYWRQRSEAFAERQRARDKDLEETRRAVIVSSQQKSADQPVVVLAPSTGVTIVQGHGRPSQSQVPTVYVTSPGAVNGRWTPLVPNTPGR
jgi:hypothetical protein